MYLLSAEIIMQMGRNFKVEVRTINDMPKLIEALETWNQFETAKAYRYIYERLKECIEWEFTIDRATKTT